MNSKYNLNYQSYFINYQMLSNSFQNLSGLVFRNQTPIAMYVVYLDIYKNHISSLTLRPIYFTMDQNDRNSASSFYKEFFGNPNLYDQLVLNSKNSMSWVPNKQSHDQTPIVNHNLTELVIELFEPEKNLISRMSRNHRRTIKYSQGMGQQIIEISSANSSQEISDYFNEYRLLHKLVSKKETRVIASFEFMENLIRIGVGKLFVSLLNQSPIAFLYCDGYRNFARGWSQVTKPDLGPKVFPRTLLEWSAIKSFKREGRSIYHLGTISNELLANNKEIKGFDEFKLRFGPTLVS